MIKRFLHIFLMLLITACGKEQSSSLRNSLITFAVSAPGLEVTRAEVSEEGLESSVAGGTVGVRLHETLINNYIYGLPLIPEQSAEGYTGRWFPESGQDKFSWTDNTPIGSDKVPAMSFFAFAFSPTSAYGSNILVGDGSRGRSVTITQPSAYNNADFVDYLLSYITDVPEQTVDGNYPLISLALEHAVAKVELYVECADVFWQEASAYRIGFTEVSFNNVKTKAVMTNLDHKRSGEAGTNTWQVSYTGEQSKYDLGRYDLDLSDKDRGPVKIMEFLALPISGTFDYTLSLKYDITDGDGVSTSFEHEPFVLSRFTPNGWKSGHKVRYTLHIDNGISLEGKILDWVDEDYIEGVILP